MQYQADILSVALKQAPMVDEMRVLQQKDLAAPGAISYTIRRMRRPGGSAVEDTGLLVYHFDKKIRKKVTSNFDSASVAIPIAAKKIQNVMPAILKKRGIAASVWKHSTCSSSGLHHNI
ncbi:MAG: hypothetical protein NVV59_19140 [Chitinophagaceae bacterium]|nr:hypothetical protein [Chitinophagaceae bacterium]